MKEPREVIQIKPFYFHGDAAIYTGKTELFYGKMAYEVKIIEGHLKDLTKWTFHPPQEI